MKRGRFSAEENTRIRQNYQEFIRVFGGVYEQLFGVGRSGKKERRIDLGTKQFYARLGNEFF